MSGESADEESTGGEPTSGRPTRGESGRTTDEAARVTLSFQPDLSDWSARRLRSEEFHDVVRGELDRVAVGDATVLDHEVGCCGWIIARLRVESVDGGTAVGTATDVELVRRKRAEEEQEP